MAFLERGNGRRIYFEDHMGPGRAFLLIHGWAMNSRAWDTTLTALKGRGHRVVSLDLRGCGLSDKDFADVSIGAMAGDATALAEHLALDRVIVNGWSLGGAVATETAHRLGNRCGGLILTCGASPRYTQAPDFPHGGTRDDIRGLLAGLAPDRATFFRGTAGAVCAKPVGEAVEAWMWSMFMQASPTADASLLDLTDIDQRRMLSDLCIPVLSVVGEADVFVAPAIGQAAAALAKDGTMVLFPGCGHAPFLEDFAGYVSAITKFADRLDAGARA
jgi:non-heme chloroperoxidase